MEASVWSSTPSIIPLWSTEHSGSGLPRGESDAAIAAANTAQVGDCGGESERKEADAAGVGEP